MPLPDHEPMITLFTDAGFDPQLRIGVWTCWAKYLGETFRNSGVLRAPCHCSSQAELAAICNGLSTARRFFDPPMRTFWLVQSDSQEALQVLCGATRLWSTKEALWLSKFRAEHGFRISAKWVKGHSGTGNPRSAVNHMCDQRCKQLLQQERVRLCTTKQENMN